MRTHNGGRRRWGILAAASAVLTSSLSLVLTTATPSAAADCARRYVAQGDGVPAGEDVSHGTEYPAKLLADHLQQPPTGTTSAPWCLYNSAKDGATTDSFLQPDTASAQCQTSPAPLECASQQSQAWSYKPSLITLQLGRQNSKLVDQIDKCYEKIRTYELFPDVIGCAQSILDDAAAWSKLQRDLSGILNTYKTQIAGNPNLVVAVLGYYNPYPTFLKVLPKIPQLCVPLVDAAVPCVAWWLTLAKALPMLDQVVKKLNTTIEPVVKQFTISSQNRFFFVPTYDKFRRHCTQMWVKLALPLVYHPPVVIDSHAAGRPVNVGCTPLSSWIAPDGQLGFFTPFQYIIPLFPPGIWLAPPLQFTTFMGVNPNDKGHGCLSDLVWETVKNKLGVAEKADIAGACSRFLDPTELIDQAVNPAPSGGDQNPDPTPVPPASAVAQGHLAAGSRHSCAVLANGGTEGTVQCWGNNDSGQLGNGTLVSSTDPVTVNAISTAKQIAAGSDHTCALLPDTTVQCWGSNTSGQLGDGTTTNRTTPVAVKGLTGVKAVTAGGAFTCAIVSDGTVKCWGDNTAGQLNDGNPGDKSTALVAARAVTTANPATAVSAGQYHTCALLADKTVTCWGANGTGQLGNGKIQDSGGPAAVQGLPDPAANPPVTLAAGGGHTCALMTDNSARCWGANESGQLGFTTPDADNDGTPDPSGPGAVQYDADASSTEALHTLFGITALAAGASHTCGLMANGSVRCWGSNLEGQLGSDPEDVASTTSAVVVPGLEGASALAAGSFHNCAIAGTGVKCWGNNADGQVDHPPVASRNAPVLVDGVNGAKTVTVGTGTVCALVDDQTTTNKPVCWGDNSHGQVGANAPAGDSTVRPVSGIPSADAIDAGNGQVCAVPAGTSSVQCWGRNGDGQVGNATTTDQFSPVPVASSGSVTGAISAGGTLDGTEHGHTCAVRSDTTVACWGGNDHGQLGDGTTADRSSPVTVRIDTDPDPSPDHVALADLTGAVSVVTGGSHSCALTSDGTVWCWGRNDHGQLGDNSVVQRTVAAQVRTNPDPAQDHPLGNVVALAAGADFTCTVLSTGGAKCWGSNGRGQLGVGSVILAPESHLPVDVPGLAAPVRAIAAGDTHVCAALANDSLSCWGGNSQGQLGDGTNADSPSPKVVMPTPPPTDHPADPPVIRSISASRANTCVTRFDMRVTCWGDNSHGQLGTKTVPLSPAPVTVPLGGPV